MNAPRRKAESRAYFRALGQHISQLRKEKGMTQADLARALQVSQQTVFAYELGDRRVSLLMLLDLARIFDTSVEELSGLKMPTQPQRRLSPAGVWHAECYLRLPKTDQRFIKKLMEILLERVAAQPSVAST
jgi:transcriptional regulator with XRE-family HTH domain